MKTLTEKFDGMQADELKRNAIHLCTNAINDVMVSIHSINQSAKEEDSLSGYDRKELDVTRYLKGKFVLVDLGVWEEGIEELYNQAGEGQLNLAKFNQIQRSYSA
jgi:hypothetical protein